MMSTRSPMAASAVPRLMAVVVLPTPPFWFAMRQNARARPGVGLANEGRGRVHGLRFSALANPEDR